MTTAFFHELLTNVSDNILMPFADREILIRLEADLHTVQLFLDHANISTSSRYLKPSKLALHTTIQRIDAQRRERRSGSRIWPSCGKTYSRGHKKGHTLIESSDCVRPGKP